MKPRFPFRKINIALLLFAVLFAAGCSETDPSDDVSSRESSEPSVEITSEDSGFSEIELPTESEESSEPSRDPYAYYPYRTDEEPNYDEISLDKNLAVTGVVFLPTSIQSEVGETVFLPWELRPRTAAPESVRFTAEDPSIASVDETGKALCLNAGKTRIIVTADGKSASCTLIVSPKSAPTPLSDRIRAVVGENDYRLYRFGLLDADGNGEKELIAQCFASESGIPVASVYRVSDGELLFSAEIGAVGERWTVRSGTYASRFVHVAHTQYPSMSGAQVCRDAMTLDAESGTWKIVRLSQRTTTSRGEFDYCAFVDGQLVSCDQATYRYFASDESVTRFERENPVLETATLVFGNYPAEIEKLLLFPPAA